MGWLADKWNDLTGNTNTGLTNVSQGIGAAGTNIGSGIGGLLGGILTPVTGVLGSTKESSTTTNAPDQSAQSNSKIITVVVVILGFVVLAVAGYLIVKSSKNS
jgi:hypothetical protein